jgi:very-short-patch-repair endonuclease
MPKYRVGNQKRSQARQLQHSLTDAEQKLWRLLRSRQLDHIKFRRQVPLGPWVVDFVSFEERLILEADGSQHAGSQRDKDRDADLKARGFRVLRFWNNDILMNSSGVLQRILETVEEAPSPRGLRPRPSPSRSWMFPTSTTLLVAELGFIRVLLGEG